MGVYGIGIDPTTANIWAGDYVQGGLLEIARPHYCPVRIPFSAPDNPLGTEVKGVVVDGTGDIWVAHCGPLPDKPPGQEVYRFDNTGQYLGRVILAHPTLPDTTGKAPSGVCVDSSQRIWAICLAPSKAEDGKYYAMRIDPTQGVDPDTGNIVGTVVEAVDLGTFPEPDLDYRGPYNYSDMSGFVALSATQPAGAWDLVQDSGADDTLWSSIILDTDLNAGSIVVEARAADRWTDLPSWPFRQLAGASGTLCFGTPPMKGRYLEVRVTLLRHFGTTENPAIKSLCLAWGPPGTALRITSHPKSQIVDLGGSTTFTVSASGSGLSYQWFKDGSALAAATASSLAIVGAQFANAGKYYARVTDSAGTVLNSAEARLHVVSTPMSSPIANVDNTHPMLGQPVNFDATMNVQGSPGPVYFQWRKSGVPIPGAHGTCTTIDGQNYSATFTIDPAQCSDTAQYSGVFINQYWKISSGPVAIQVVDGLGDPVPQVVATLAPAGPITDRHNPPTLTAVPCFSSGCGQWYRCDQFGGSKKAIPGATGPAYTFPNPVPCDLLPYFMYEAFDEGHVPHPSNVVYVYGDCEPPQ